MASNGATGGGTPRERLAVNFNSRKVFKFKCTYSGTIADAMKRRGWIQVEDEVQFDINQNWDIFWCDMNQVRDVFSMGSRPLADRQRVGHFKNCQEISRKNLLVKNLKKLRFRIEKAFGREEGKKCNFMPTTFILPTEHKAFVLEFRTRSELEENLWIIKPAAGAQGRGIFIFKTLKDYYEWRASFETNGSGSSEDAMNREINQFFSTVDQQGDPSMDPATLDLLLMSDPSALLTDSITSSYNTSDIPTTTTRNHCDSYVVQRYISNPYLIGGRKFDIRFYVLVTSFNPLKAWIYREGFARFSAGQFSLDALQDVYIHLTNVAIQRTSEDYNPEKGSKWSLQSLREYLTARHGKEKVQTMFNVIDSIVIRTLQSVNQLIVQDKHCFEVYGFDVLIDKELFPWLLEVNASPAFTPSNEEDYILKCGLIDDTVTVLDLERRLTGYEKRLGGYDLIWNEGPVYANPADCGHAKGLDDGPKLNSYLGCINDRVPQLRDIYRNANFIKSAYQMLSSNAGYKSESYMEEQHAYGFNIPKYPRKIVDNRFRLPTS